MIMGFLSTNKKFWSVDGNNSKHIHKNVQQDYNLGYIILVIQTIWNWIFFLVIKY